jgi:hypothetical protein
MAKYVIQKAQAQLSHPQAKDELTRHLNNLASAQLRQLLETKHLYQKVSFDPTEIVSAIRAVITNIPNLTVFMNWVQGELIHRPMPLTKEPLPLNYLTTEHQPPFIVVQNIKLFCKKCGEREAFMPAWFADITEPSKRGGETNPAVKFAPSNPVLQLLILVYQCQVCTGQPEAFIVRRAGWHLELHGRSPMEQVEVPAYIPRPESRLFSDSVIAFNSGKSLAALFYLRSFIEQFARRMTNQWGRVTGDEIMIAYADTLPPAQRDAMPSLREWYDKLSVPIHSAKDDNEVYEVAKVKIEEHFDIRRAFRMPETVIEPKKASDGGDAADSAVEKPGPSSTGETNAT